MATSSEQLKIQYQDNAGRAERLREAVVVQMTELLSSGELTLGVPMESRVKSWGSIEEKLERKSIEIDSIFALHDIVGVRVILLFRSDLDRALKLIAENFEVVSREDTGSRLGEAEFGYQSQHFVVRLPKAWLSLPSLANLNEFCVELQVRTLAQHIWAAASHKLQYKQEAGVPPPVRRAINRVSALLETVDLEFERVLNERQRYVAETLSSPHDNEAINVDSLASLLTDLLPPENRKESEGYAELLPHLTALGVTTLGRLRQIICSHLEKAIERDKALVVENRARADDPSKKPETIERLGRGVFYSHAGLVREALRQEFGAETANAVWTSKRRAKRRAK